MTDRKPSVENDGELELLQLGDRLDTTFTNDRLPQKTGILRGWIPSPGTLGTQITIGDGVGWLVDNETDPELPVPTKQVSGPFVDVTVLNVATQVFTFFYIDIAGALQQQNTFPTRSERRTQTFVAASFQPLGVVSAVYPIGSPAFEGDFFAQDILLEEGTKFLGNVYAQATAGTPDPLNIKVSEGFIGYSYANRQDTVASRRDPHFAQQDAVDPISWAYVVNDGSDEASIVASAVSLFDTLNRSDGIGGITPLTNNRSGMAVISRDSIGNTVIEYTVADFRPADTTARDALIAAIQASRLTISVPFVAIYALEYPRNASTLADCVFHRLLAQSVGGTATAHEDIFARDQIGDDLSTGAVEWDGMVVNGGDPAATDIGDGQGWVVDSHSGTESIVTKVTWTSIPPFTPTNIATQRSTFIALDFSGGPTPVIIESAVDFTLVQRRDLIVLGRIVHTDFATVTSLIHTVCPTYNTMLSFADFLVSFGPFNLEGNVYGTTGANLIPHKTAGKSFKLGASVHINRKDPNRTVDPEDGPGLTGLTFGYLFRSPATLDGFDIEIPLTSFDPNIYDDGTQALFSNLPTVPNNQWTFQTLFFFPQENNHRFHLGQDFYANKDDAIAAITGDPITGDPFLNTAVRRGWLVVKQGTTDLTNTANAVFLVATDVAFGGGGGGGGATNSDVALTIGAPHVIEANTASMFEPSVARNVVEIVVRSGVATSGSGGSFTFELFHGPTLASLTSIDTVTVLQGDQRGVTVLGVPAAVPADDMFVVDTTAIGAFPIGTKVRRKRFYLHVRMTPG